MDWQQRASPAFGTIGGATDPPRPWWESRLFLASLVLLSTVPLLYPQVPPLVDLPGHMGRYRVELDLATSPWLHLYYDFHWAAIGNLGVDLLVLPLGRLLGLEAAVKLIVIAIPVLTVAGWLWVAREVHHREPPTALFALPFAYGFPFLYGFVNFALSMALAMLAFGLWLHLAGIGRTRLRAALFVPISIIVFFTHAYGWGTLGLLCFSAEAVRQHDSGAGWFKSAWKAAIRAAVMALPLGIMLAWREETHGGMTRNWFEWQLKWEWIYSALRDRWPWFDQGSVAVVGLLLLFALFSRRLSFSRNLAFSAIVLAAAFVLIPWTVFGSAYADMRLVPYVFAMAILAIRFKGATDLRLGRWLAVIGLGFFLVRLAGVTASLAMAADRQQVALQALDRVPMGARVANIVGRTCHRPWALPRDAHLGGLVIVRRQGFSNDQWVIEGQNLLELRYRQAGVFSADASQVVRPNGCRLPWTIDEALLALPRRSFDYVWMVGPPPFDPELVRGMELAWSGGPSRLYRIIPAGAESPPATPRRASARGRRGGAPVRTPRRAVD